MQRAPQPPHERAATRGPAAGWAAAIGAAVPATQLLVFLLFDPILLEFPSFWLLCLAGALAGLTALERYRQGAGLTESLAVYAAASSVAAGFMLLLAIADLIPVLPALELGAWASVPVSLVIYMAVRGTAGGENAGSGAGAGVDEGEQQRAARTPDAGSPRNPLPALLGGLAAVAVIGSMEARISPLLSLDVLYLAVVLLVTARSHLRAGLIVGIFAAGYQGIAQQSFPASGISSWIAAWNSAALLAGLVIGAFLMARLQSMVRRERRLARTDPLTGLLNRRAFSRLAARELALSNRHGTPISLALIDLDGFKEVNDRFGHAEGDACLVTVAEVLRRRFRGTDLLARMGGDEFIILLSGAGEVEARAAIDSFREELAQRMGAEAWPVSASIGLVQRLHPGTDIPALLHRADELMYTAKRGGKDRVEVAVG